MIEETLKRLIRKDMEKDYSWQFLSGNSKDEIIEHKLELFIEFLYGYLVSQNPHLI